MKRIINLGSFSRVFRVENRSTIHFPMAHAKLHVSTSRGTQFSCWKCKKPLPENKFSLQCPTCQSLQRPNMDNNHEGVNYFKIFGHKETYRVDPSKLSVEMKNLQKNLHPDLFSLKTREEQQLSEELSSLVNKAYSTLQDPIERAQYLLQLHGVDLSTLEKKMTTDAIFLTEVMDLNERLEEINDSPEWAQFRQENNQKIIVFEGELETAFDSADIDKATLVLAKLKYYVNLQEKLKTLQSRLGVVD